MLLLFTFLTLWWWWRRWRWWWWWRQWCWWCFDWNTSAQKIPFESQPDFKFSSHPSTPFNRGAATSELQGNPRQHFRTLEHSNLHFPTVVQISEHNAQTVNHSSQSGDTNIQVSGKSKTRNFLLFYSADETTPVLAASGGKIRGWMTVRPEESHDSRPSIILNSSMTCFTSGKPAYRYSWGRSAWSKLPLDGRG